MNGTCTIQMPGGHPKIPGAEKAHMTSRGEGNRRRRRRGPRLCALEDSRYRPKQTAQTAKRSHSPCSPVPKLRSLPVPGPHGILTTTPPPPNSPSPPSIPTPSRPTSPRPPSKTPSRPHRSRGLETRDRHLTRRRLPRNQAAFCGHQVRRHVAAVRVADAEATRWRGCSGGRSTSASGRGSRRIS